MHLNGDKELQILKDKQYYKFSLYGFFKNLRFYESFLILFFLSKGIDYIKIGLLYSIREITVAILEIPSGLIADALGRKKTLIISFLFYMISFTIFYFSNHYGLMAIAMIFYAIGDAFRTGVHKSMIFHYLKIKGLGKQKAAYYGHTRSWSQIGSALSALIAGLLVYYTDSYKIIFIASIIPYLFDMILIASYPEFLNGNIKHLKKTNLSSKFKLIFHAFYLSFKQLHFLKSITNLSLHTGYYKAIKDYIQPLMMGFALSIPWLTNMEDKKKTAIIVGVFYFFIYLATSFTSRHAGEFKSYFKRFTTPLNITLITGFMSGIFSGIFYNNHWFLLSIFTFIIILLLENLRKPIGIAYVANQSNDNAMATILSVQSQYQSLFTAIIAPIIGFAAQFFGVGIGISIATIFLLLFFPLYYLKEKKDKFFK